MNNWIPLEEFLENPIYGWCWITIKFWMNNKINYMIAIAYYAAGSGKFFYNNEFDDSKVYDFLAISDIMPITFPELPTKYARNI